MHSGVDERMPYSLSRWTDLPIDKWDWFKEQLRQGWMLGFDPRTAMPGKWSLEPEKTFGLIFWTKDPANIVKDAKLLDKFPLVLHVTLNGWPEVEVGAPGLWRGVSRLAAAVEQFGVERVVWRFSPIPLLYQTEVILRFEVIAKAAARLGLKRVYASFLQSNDLMMEQRTVQERQSLLRRMADVTSLEVVLCQDDKATLVGSLDMPHNLRSGVCEDGSIFGRGLAHVDDCGCALAVDPFTVNETCSLGCGYCYAADKGLSQCRRNTT
jgi:hypothetical protein